MKSFRNMTGNPLPGMRGFADCHGDRYSSRTDAVVQSFVHTADPADLWNLYGLRWGNKCAIWWIVQENRALRKPWGFLDMPEMVNP